LITLGKPVILYLAMVQITHIVTVQGILLKILYRKVKICSVRYVMVIWVVK